MREKRLTMGHLVAAVMAVGVDAAAFGEDLDFLQNPSPFAEKFSADLSNLLVYNAVAGVASFGFLWYVTKSFKNTKKSGFAQIAQSAVQPANRWQLYRVNPAKPRAPGALN